MSKTAQNIYLVWQAGEKNPSAFRYKTGVCEYLGLSYKTIQRYFKDKPTATRYTIIQTELK